MLARLTFVAVTGLGLFESPWYTLSLVAATTACVLTCTWIWVRCRPDDIPHATGGGDAGPAFSMNCMEILWIVKCLKEGPKDYGQIRYYLYDVEGSEVRCKVTGLILEKLAADGVVERGPKPGQFRLTAAGRSIASQP